MKSTYLLEYIVPYHTYYVYYYFSSLFLNSLTVVIYPEVFSGIEYFEY